VGVDWLLSGHRSDARITPKEIDMKKLIVALIAVFAFSSFALADEATDTTTENAAPQAQTSEQAAPTKTEAKMEHHKAVQKAKKAKKRSKKQVRKMEKEDGAE
jgi:hypothetical protein